MSEAPNQTQWDAARIEAEITRPDQGSDPFAAAMRSTTTPMVVSNPRLPDNPVVFANDSFCRLTGYAREEVIGRNCRFLQGPETNPATVRSIRDAIQARRGIETDIRNHRKDGSAFWNRLSIGPVWDAQGEIAFFYANQLDVTIERERLAGLEESNAALLAELADRLRSQEASEARLLLSEQSLRLATETAEIGIWDLDLATDTLTLSDRTKAMFGIPADMACSMDDFYRGLHPEDAAAVTEAFAAAVDPARQAVYDVEYRTIGRDGGTVRWVAAKGAGIFDSGRCVRAVGTAINITLRREQRRRETFLLELSDRMRHLSDPADIRAAACRLLGRHLGACRVGYSRRLPNSPRVALRTCFTDGAAPLDGVFRLDQLAADALPERDATDLPEPAASEPGPEERWDAPGVRSWASTPISRGEPLGEALVVQSRAPRLWGADELSLLEDVAARTWDAWVRARAEAELREANDALERLIAERTATLQTSEARMRTVFETSYQLMGLLTPDGIVVDINPTALTAAGVALADVAGLPFWDAPWFSRKPAMRDWMRDAVAAAAEGEDVRGEVALELPSGVRTYDISLRPVLEAGRVVAIVPEAVDITDRRQTEEALRQAQKMEAVGQLTGGIAHDFNNLLSGIMGSLELVQRRVAAGRTKELERYTSAAITSAQRAAALTQRLLAFARRQPLDPRRVEANRMVASMEDLLRRTLGPAIQLEMVLSGGLWPTLCDPNQLESAILNLAINARDAMPEGGRLTIETSNAHLDDAYARAQAGEVKAGQYVTVAVTDTGTGMTPEVVAKAFDPFFTTKPTGQGTGLGLSMLYGFVKQSDGHVRIYSEPEHGTTFRLYLPRYLGAPERADQAGASASPVSGADVGETVLVVDDEPTLRMLVRETLEELGYHVIEAADGAAGLRAAVSAARLDLLVTDVGMPVLNGRQLADAARLARPGLRVLFMTGYAHNAAVGTGLALQADMQIISKPFALDALARKVREMIGGV